MFERGRWGEGYLHNRDGCGDSAEAQRGNHKQAIPPSTCPICVPHLSQVTHSPAPKMCVKLKMCKACFLNQQGESLLPKGMLGQTHLTGTQRGLSHFRTFGPALARAAWATSTSSPHLVRSGHPMPFPGSPSRTRKIH